MRNFNIGSHATAAWLGTLQKILRDGVDVAPRGKPTLEIMHHVVKVDMSKPAVICKERGLSYTFMAAEALWILDGDDLVQGIAPYNKNIAEFSDDGVKFFGAYGPKVVAQLGYVVEKLLQDKDSRQAVLTIWRENPPATRDVPCTVALAFSIRKDSLHCHAFMRSSDVWLGLPYDMFNFSMIAARVACEYNAKRRPERMPVGLGWLYMTLCSSHMYATNFDAAAKCIEDAELIGCEALPDEWITGGSFDRVYRALRACRDKTTPHPGDRRWNIRPEKQS